MAEEPFLFADFAPAASEPAVFDLSVNRPWHDGEKNVRVQVALGRAVLSAGRTPAAGDVLELNSAANEEFEILCDGSPVAKGRLAQKDGQFGVVITRILTQGDEPCA